MKPVITEKDYYFSNNFKSNCRRVGFVQYLHAVRLGFSTRKKRCTMIICLSIEGVEGRVSDIRFGQPVDIEIDSCALLYDAPHIWICQTCVCEVRRIDLTAWYSIVTVL